MIERILNSETCLQDGQVAVYFSDLSYNRFTIPEFVQLVQTQGFRVISSRRLHTRIQLSGETTTFLITTELYHKIINRTISGLSVVKCGVELEFCCPRSSIEDLKVKLASVVSFVDRSEHHGVSSETSWVLTYDGSLTNGAGYQSFELVSPPLPVNDLSQLQSVLAIMNELNCFVNRKCGTHVHFSFGHSLSRSVLTDLYEAYRRWETFFDHLVSYSRRGDRNSYCKSCLDNWESSRYHKFNPKAYEKHGTVEVRHHQGTLSFTKISHWILLFTKWFNHYEGSCDNFSDGLNTLGFTLSEKEWYLNRMAELE